jgi:hypothetical protein
VKDPHFCTARPVRFPYSALACFAPRLARLSACRPASLRDHNPIAGLSITALGWVGFVTFCGYIVPVAGTDLTCALAIVGLGFVIRQLSGTLHPIRRSSQCAKAHCYLCSLAA